MVKQIQKLLRKDITQTSKKIIRHNQAIELAEEKHRELTNDLLALKSQRVQLYKDLLENEYQDSYISLFDLASILEDVKTIRESEEFYESFIAKIKSFAVHKSVIVKDYNEDDDTVIATIEEDELTGEMAIRLYEENSSNQKPENLYTITIAKKF